MGCLVTTNNEKVYSSCVSSLRSLSISNENIQQLYEEGGWDQSLEKYTQVSNKFVKCKSLVSSDNFISNHCVRRQSIVNFSNLYSTLTHSQAMQQFPSTLFEEDLFHAPRDCQLTHYIRPNSSKCNKPAILGRH